MLLAYRGFCKNCGAEQRVYFARCDERMRGILLNESKLYKHKGTCDACFIDKGHKGTVNWEARLPYYQADKDLAILGNGVQLDQKDIDANENEIQTNDAWWENQHGRVEEYKEHLKKKL